MNIHQHDHDHEHHAHGSELGEMQLRVRALETILTEKGYVDPKALDFIIDAYETKIGPHIGARIIARAWADADFKRRLIAVENKLRLHNIVVCTLCSCYPWEILGLPPVWYKAAPYRSRTVIDPRGVLREFGLELADDVEVRVWDSTAEVRYLVLPERP